MTRKTRILLCAAGLLALLAVGSDESAGQEAKADVKVPPAKEAKAEDKAPPAKADAKAPPTKGNAAVPVKGKAEGKEIKAAVRVVAPRVAMDAANMQQWEQQFLPQFRQIHRMEMHFVRIVCEPTRPQYDAVAADGEAAMKAALRGYAEAMNGMRQAGRNEQFDPRAAIAQAIAKSVQAHLPPDRAERYRKELDLRTESRKRMAVMNLVALIDRTVLLSADQREKLADVLRGNWNSSWDQPMVIMYAGQYFPQLPDAKITPILTEQQRTVWGGITKTTVNFGMNLGIVPGVEVEDEVFDGDPPRKDNKAVARPPVPAKAEAKR